MSNYLKNKIARLIDSRKYDWLWEKISDTYLGYYVRKVLMSFMGIHEEFAVRDIVAGSRDYILKMTHPHDHESRFNVLLIQLPLPSNRRHKRILPLGLAYLAAYLRKEDPEINIGILDSQCQNMTRKEIMDKIKETKWNVIGISLWSVQSKFAAELSKDIRAYDKKIIIVHGGVHPTVVPEDSAGIADYAVTHEGEETFTELIGALKNGRDVIGIKGVVWFKNGNMMKNEFRPVMKSMDRLPFPAYDLLPIENYKMPLHVVGGDRLPIMGSRGCPYNCSFCTSPNLWQNKVRWRDAKNVVDEMDKIIKEYGVNKFHFWDDNFTLNPRFVREFCQEIENRKISIQWIALDRAEHINRNRDLLPMMKKSGCVGIELGLESANPDTFPYISKNQGVDESKNAISNLRGAGIIPLYTCMAFNPGESIVGYYMQKEFLDKAQEGFSWHRFFHPYPYPVYVGQFATPYPKTKFWDNLEKESIILVDTPEDRYHHQINSIPFSLLDDIPIRTVEKLDEELYMIFLNSVKLNFWTMFPGNDPKDILARKLFDVWRFIKSYFSKCDGKRSVKQIGKELAQELDFPFNKAMRLTAFATYIYAQVGVIRSAVQYKDYKIERKHIKVPLTTRKDIKSLIVPLLGSDSFIPD